MENGIFFVTTADAKKIKQEIEVSGTFIAEIDGYNVGTLSNYLATMSSLFQFPIPASTMHGYNDWMGDLSWLETDGYTLIIHNYNEFMKSEPEK